MQAGRHELQPGEGSFGEQERAGGGSGGESSAWRGALICLTDSSYSCFQEAEQLKLVLKRELDRMEAELRTKDAIISDYKNITQILQVCLFIMNNHYISSLWLG